MSQTATVIAVAYGIAVVLGSVVAFGVYDDEHRLVFQAQVVPGKTQKVVHTFRRPGHYQVLCLEFCGLKHHEMLSTLRVTAG